MGSEPDVLVEPSPEELAEKSAGRLVATLVAALGVRPVAHLGLTGGGILEQVMRAVRDLPARDSVEWHRVHVWWADERYVPADSDDRNDKAAFAALLDHLPLDPALIHRMPASDSQYGEDVEAAAAAYAAELAAAVPPEQGGDVPHFDALLLGIGPDGHCASLFPEHPGVYEEEAAVIAVRNSPKPPPTRLSLTFRALDAANEVWFIASGEGKAKAVAMALSGADR
ncbi:MAG: 6-phosphogluconolactonase, partial [Pseudonocardiales bacterium]|nr:6-phosphogluconolactonase [Pseudonocardiales bacterium]